MLVVSGFFCQDAAQIRRCPNSALIREKYDGWILSKLRKPVGGWTGILLWVWNAHRQCTRECCCAPGGRTAGGRSACVCDASGAGRAGCGGAASIGDEYVGEDLDRLGDCLCCIWRSGGSRTYVCRSSRTPKSDRAWLIAF